MAYTCTRTYSTHTYGKKKPVVLSPFFVLCVCAKTSLVTKRVQQNPFVVRRNFQCNLHLLFLFGTTIISLFGRYHTLLWHSGPPMMTIHQDVPILEAFVPQMVHNCVPDEHFQASNCNE